MSKQQQLTRLEARVTQLEERLVSLEKLVHAHNHNITDSTVAAIATFVKQDIVSKLTPPAPPPQAEEQPEQAG